jgi:hypothetical protein
VNIFSCCVLTIFYFVLVMIAVFIHYYFCVWQADGAAGLPPLAAELNALPPVSGLFAS